MSADLTPAEDIIFRRHYVGRVRQEIDNLAMVCGLEKHEALGFVVEQLTKAHDRATGTAPLRGDAPTFAIIDEVADLAGLENIYPLTGRGGPAMKKLTFADGGELRYLTRADWGAGAITRGKSISSSSFKGLVSHHTVMDHNKPGDLVAVKSYMARLHRSRPDLGSEVPYSWVILAGAGPFDADVCEGRGVGRTGAHTAGLNSSRYGIAWAMNTEDTAVTPGMVRAFRWLAEEMLADPLNAVPTQGHFHTFATACPGKDGKRVLEQLQPPFANSDSSPAPPVVPVSTSGPSGRPVLGPPGSGHTHSGPAVRHWQMTLNALLNMLGVASRVLVTGNYDETTRKTTENFQEWAKIGKDGIVGNLETRPAMSTKLTEAAIGQAQRQNGFRVRPLNHPTPVELWEIAK